MVRVRCRVENCGDSDEYPSVELAERDGWTVALNPGEGPSDICPDHTEAEMSGDDPDLLEDEDDGSEVADDPDDDEDLDDGSE